MPKQFLVALALFAASSVVIAQAPCAADPQAKDAAACDFAGWMSAYGRMTGEMLNVIERLRALASSNLQLKAAETRFTDSQQEWHVRVIADCDARSAGLMVAAMKQSRFLICETDRMIGRTAAIARYVAQLKSVQAAPGTKPPIAPSYSCPYTDAELATVAPTDACMIKAAAKRCDNSGDTCLVRCLATGGAKFIGGGCYHVCARHGLRGTPWDAPTEAASCTTRG